MLHLNKKQRWILSATVLLIFIVFIELYVGWTKLLYPWRSVNLWLLTGALGMVLSSYLIRAIRLYDYFHRIMQGAFSLALKLMLQHNLANNFLPMRSGEVTFPVLMAVYFHLPISNSVPALLWFRLFDLHTLILLALWAVGNEWWSTSSVGFVIVLWLLLPWLFFASSHWLLDKLDTRRANRLIGLIVKLLEGSPATLGLLFRTWFWTLLNWLLKLIAFAWLLILFADLTAAQALLGVIGGELTSVLPVHGVAGAGTYEAGIVAALVPFGINPEVALSAAVNLHLFLLGATLVGAMLSLLIRKRHVD